MDIGTIISVGRSSLLEIILIASPVLLVAVGVGLIISIGQAITSIQEQTLTFVPKIVFILITLIFLGPWMINEMLTFTQSLWRQMIFV